MRRWFTFGMYTLGSHIKKVDWLKVFDDIRASNFTGLSQHVLSPWGQDRSDPSYPWPYMKNGKFNLKKMDGDWKDAFRFFVREARKKRIDIELCLFDRYFIPKWLPYIKIHPFVHNNIGVRLREDFQLYNSLDGVNRPPFVWIQWDDITTPQAGNWRPVGPLGNALFEYVYFVLDEVAEAQRLFPKRGRVIIKPFNEQRADRTDRHEIIQWLQYEGKKRGLVTSRRFKWAFDYGSLETDDDIYAQLMLGGYHGFVKNAHREIHGVGKDGRDHNWYLNLGMRKNKLIFSTDGCPAGVNKPMIQQLWNSNMPFCDAKQEEADVPYKFSTKNMMRNWNIGFPHHAEYLR